jgi:lactose/L-arabinose transport system substrate-binding protein
MKKHVLMSVFLIMALLFSACSKSSETETSAPTSTAANNMADDGTAKPANPGEISGNLEVWLYTDKITLDPINALLPKFYEKYPNIKVNITPVSGTDAPAKLMTTISSGKAIPDVVQISDPNIRFFQNQDALSDVTAKMTPFKDQVLPWKLAMGTVDGKNYSIPIDGAMTVMFYRKDIFEKAGINPEQIETWDDFIQAGKKITESTNGKVKMVNLPIGSTGDKAGIVYFFEEVSHQLGGRLFSKDKVSTVNSKENVKVLELFRKMIDSGITDNTQPWSPAEFAQWKEGSVATVVNASWMKGIIESEAPDTSGKWGIMLAPGFEKGGNRISSYLSSEMVIPKATKNFEAAWAFTEFFLLNKEVVPQLYKMGAPFPSLMSAYNDPAFKKPDEFWGGQLVGELLTQNEPKVPVKELVAMNWDQLMNNVLPEYLFQAVQKGADIQAILDKAKKALEEQAQY